MVTTLVRRTDALRSFLAASKPPAVRSESPIGRLPRIAVSSSELGALAYVCSVRSVCVPCSAYRPTACPRSALVALIGWDQGWRHLLVDREAWHTSGASVSIPCPTTCTHAPLAVQTTH